MAGDLGGHADGRDHSATEQQDTSG
jgi:hypothetical protein